MLAVTDVGWTIVDHHRSGDEDGATWGMAVHYTVPDDTVEIRIELLDLRHALLTPGR